MKLTLLVLSITCRATEALHIYIYKERCPNEIWTKRLRLLTYISTHPSLHDVYTLVLRNRTIMRRGAASCQHCPPTPRRRFKQKNGLARHETFIPSKWMMTVEVRGGWLAPVPPPLPPLKRCYLTRGGRMTLGPTGNSHSLPSPSVRSQRERVRTDEGGRFCTYVPPVCELRGLSPPLS